MRDSTSNDTRNRGNVYARLREFLRAFAPRKTGLEVSARCALAGHDVPARSIDRWLAGDGAPGFAHMAALLDTFGPPLLVALLPGRARWLDAALREQSREDYERRRAALEAEFRGRV